MVRGFLCASDVIVCVVELCYHVLMSLVADMSTIISELQWLRDEDLFALSWQNGGCDYHLRFNYLKMFNLFIYVHISATILSWSKHLMIHVVCGTRTADRLLIFGLTQTKVKRHCHVYLIKFYF